MIYSVMLNTQAGNSGPDSNRQIPQKFLCNPEIIYCACDFTGENFDLGLRYRQLLKSLYPTS